MATVKMPGHLQKPCQWHDYGDKVKKLSKEHRFSEALRIAVNMQQHEMPLSRDVIYHLLQGCAKQDLAAVRHVHSLMAKSQLDSVVCFQDHLIRLYAACGSLMGAKHVFHKVVQRTVITWNSIISAHANLGASIEALGLFDQMQQEEIVPDKVTFLCALKACSVGRALVQGRVVHGHIIRNLTESDVTVSNTLVDMYSKCGSLDEARRVFDQLPDRDVVSWDTLIGGYAQQGQNIAALELFSEMQQEGFQPDQVTFLGVMRACCSAEMAEFRHVIHDLTVRCKLECDAVIANTLVDMYARCGGLEEARRVFDQIASPDLVSWSAMICGYVQQEQGFSALELFKKMQEKGILPDKYIISTVLEACGDVKALVLGRLVHEQIIEEGIEIEVDEIVLNALMDMYAKCGRLNEALDTFDNLTCPTVVSWGVVISGFVQHGHGQIALGVFQRMQELGFQPSKVTYLCALKACSLVGDEGHCRLIHNNIVKKQLEQDVLIGSSLVDMYAKCGNVLEARQVFDRLRNRNIVTWSAMIAGYTLQGFSVPCLDLYEELHSENLEPNRAILLCTLKCCSSVGAVRLGRQLHWQIIKGKLEADLALGNALVDMYGKCGSLHEAEIAFNNMPIKDVDSWNAIIKGHAECGSYNVSMQYLERMLQQGLKPDQMVFTSVLAACSHAGLLDKAHGCFKSMKEHYSIVPDIEHFSCMIDLLGRSGRLVEAEGLLETMPRLPDVVVWRSLLTSCRSYGNLQLGKRCFEQAIQLEGDDPSAYSLMYDMYGDANRWADAHVIKRRRICIGAQKKPGITWIEIRNKVYEFVVDEESCPLSQKVGTPVKVKTMNYRIRSHGYLPQVDSVLDLGPDVDKTLPQVYGNSNQLCAINTLNMGRPQVFITNCNASNPMFNLEIQHSMSNYAY